MSKLLKNAHKLVYLAKKYPDLKIRELGGMFQLSVLEINTAIWKAKELGYLYVDEKTGFYKIEKEPKWQMGEEVDELTDMIQYCSKQLAANKNDIEDGTLRLWTAALPTHDVEIALQRLLEDKKLTKYEVVNVTTKSPSKKGLKLGKKDKVFEDPYTFYCLPKNLVKQWGRKQFRDESKLKAAK